MNFSSFRLAHAVRATSLLACLTPFLLANGQAPASAAPASHSASCKIDNSEPSDLDNAYARREIKKAATLAAAAYAKNPADRKSRQFEIDILIAQNKIDDARKKTEAWTTSDPNDAFAILTASELRYAEGDWPESYALALRALKLDPCMPDAFADLAVFEESAGYRATAAKHLAIAHQMAPNSVEIRPLWLNSLPLQQRLEEREKYFQTSKTITDKERPAIRAALSRMAAESEHHCELASATGAARIPMTPINQGGADPAWGLEIAFNGRKRILQIDTGASGFILTRSAGGSLALPGVNKSYLGGFGDQGVSGAVLGHAASVHIGGLEFTDCVVETLANDGVLGGTQMGYGQRKDAIDGIVGSDIFDRYLVTLDFVKHEVRLEPLPQNPATHVDASQLDALGGRKDVDWMLVDRYIAPAMQSWTKIYRQGHTLIMPTYLHTEANTGRTVLFVVDTGAFTNLADTNAIKEFSSTKDSLMYSRGLSGVQKMGETGKFTVDFAGLRLPVSSMDSTDLSRFGGGIIGFFGFTTLQQLVMHIDYRDNLASFEAPNAKH